MSEEELLVCRKMLNHPLLYSGRTTQFNKQIGFVFYYWLEKHSGLSIEWVRRFDVRPITENEHIYLYFNPLTGETEIGEDHLKQMLHFMKLE